MPCAEDPTMNAVPHPVRRHALSVAEYERMVGAGVFEDGTRVELIEGELFDMAPIGPDHQSIVDLLTEAFVFALGRRAIVRVQGPIVLGDLSAPEPDIALLRRRANFYADAHPRAPDVLLAVEVADSSLAHDRDVKLPTYARYDVPEVWLIDVTGKRLTVYGDLDRGEYRRRDELDSLGPLAPAALPDALVDLAGLFG